MFLKLGHVEEASASSPRPLQGMEMLRFMEIRLHKDSKDSTVEQFCISQTISVIVYMALKHKANV